MHNIIAPQMIIEFSIKTKSEAPALVMDKILIFVVFRDIT